MNKSSLIMNDNPKSLTAEAFRTLRTHIQHSREHGDVKSILFTSSCQGEGKSTVVANTAIALAQTGKKIIILDCDLRKPAQHELFRKRKTHNGITNYVLNECTLADTMQETGIQNLKLIAGGQIHSNPAQILESDRFQDGLALLKKQADYILIDSPPVLPVTDASILCAKSDGTILVVGVGIVRPALVQKAKEYLESTKGRMLGIVTTRSELPSEQKTYIQYYETTVCASG